MSLLHKLKFKYIQFVRYVFKAKYMPIMSGHLKGIKWSTASSYAYIIGDYEEPHILSWLENKFKEDNAVFYDLGANIGYYSFLVSKIRNNTKIYAFEPIAEHRKTFAKHLELNPNFRAKTIIEIIPKAISDKDEFVTFSNSPNSESNTLVKDSPNFISSNNIITIGVTSIDSFVLQGNTPPTLIKIDVEGAEYEALKGSMNTLKKYKPAILLATHEHHKKGVTEECVSLLTELGYSLKSVRINKPIGLEDFIAEYKTN